MGRIRSEAYRESSRVLTMTRFVLRAALSAWGRVGRDGRVCSRPVRQRGLAASLRCSTPPSFRSLSQALSVWCLRSLGDIEC